MNRRIAGIIAAAAVCAATAVGCGGGAYPSKAVSGIIQWGAGGGTDTLMRPLCSAAEEQWGTRIQLTNMSGGTGTIATQYVFDQAADGYTLLLGAENPAMYDFLELSELTYEDFCCVLLIGSEQVGLTVAAGSAYPGYQALIDAANAAPGTVRMATTGKGGLPWTVTRMLEAVTGATFLEIPFDSDASARTAVLNGECDVTVSKVQSGLPYAQAGELTYLAMLADAPVEGLETVPLLPELDPAYADYLPWGPFYGVFVRADTDAAVIETLTDAFLAAYETDGYQTVLKNNHILPLGLTGADAERYIGCWRDATRRMLAP